MAYPVTLGALTHGKQGLVKNNKLTLGHVSALI